MPWTSLTDKDHVAQWFKVEGSLLSRSCKISPSSFKSASKEISKFNFICLLGHFLLGRTMLGLSLGSLDEKLGGSN